MPKIVIVKNIFKKEDMQSFDTSATTIFDAILEHFPKGTSSDGGYAKIDVSLNGKAVDVINYDTTIGENDVVIAVAVVEYTYVVGFLINLAIAAAVSYAMSLLFAPKESIQPAEGRPTYTIRESQMRAKEGEVIPEIFGKFKTFPSLISAPYIRYENNEEYMYLTAAVGKGFYTFDNIYLEQNSLFKTLTNTGRECEERPDSVVSCLNKAQDILKVVKIEPFEADLANGINNKVASFLGDTNYHHLVYTPDELNDFSLQDAYALNEFCTPIPLFKGTDKVFKIEVDTSLPGGIFNVQTIKDTVNILGFDVMTGSHTEAVPYTISYAYNVFYQDELGNHITVSGGEQTISYTDNTKQPFNFTTTITLTTPGQYYIKFKNLTAKNNNPSNPVNDQYLIKRVKAFILNDEAINYNETTFAVFKLKAGSVFSQMNQLNLSLVVSRKGLSTLDKVVQYIWNTAAYDYKEIFNVLENTRGFTCNGILDSKFSVFDSLNLLLRARRLFIVPTLYGFNIKKDDYRPYRTYIFDTSKIKKGSLIESSTFAATETNDSIAMTYFDENYEKKTVVYPTFGVNSEESFLIGITNKADVENQARIGYNKKIYESKVVEFETELEGFIPEIGDRIGVAHTYMQQEDTYVAEKIATSGTIFILDREVYLSPLYVNKCIIRSSSYSLDNEYTITFSGLEGVWTNQIEVDGLIASNFNELDIAFIIGKAGKIVKDYIVQKIEPQQSAGNFSIKITGTRYDENVYTDVIY